MNDAPSKDDDIIPPGEQLPVLADTGLTVALNRSEIDVQIETAKKFPRQLKETRDRIMSLATLDPDTAAAAIYALPPRAGSGKAIKGPSIRFAEIVATQWPNARIDARVVAVDRNEKVVVAHATFHDLETNVATRTEERRRIVDKRGRLYSDDMIIVTGKAACSIARRNAILAGVPQAIWQKAWDECNRLVAGDIKSLAERRDRALKAFAVLGVKPEQLYHALEIASVEEITLDHLTTLQGMHSALKSGESTVEEMFPKEPPTPSDAWKPPEPTPHDAHTGEIIDEYSVIHKVELEVIDNQVENWPSWGKRFLQYINAAPDILHIDEWLKQNSTMLDSLKQDSPRTATIIESGIMKRREALQAK